MSCNQRKYVCTEIQIAYNCDDSVLERLQARLRERDIHVLNVKQLPDQPV